MVTSTSKNRARAQESHRVPLINLNKGKTSDTISMGICNNNGRTPAVWQRVVYFLRRLGMADGRCGMITREDIQTVITETEGYTTEVFITSILELINTTFYFSRW